MEIKITLANIMANGYTFTYVFKRTWDLMKISQGFFDLKAVESLAPFEREWYIALISAELEQEKKEMIEKENSINKGMSKVYGK